jgi:hypothetical protein
MRNRTNLAEPEPRRGQRGEETTRLFWKPELPEATAPRLHAPKAAVVPYLLAPYPWPQGQFKINPED